MDPFDLQRIQGRDANGVTIDATRNSETGEWSATIDDQDGGIREDVPITFRAEGPDAIIAAFNAAIDD
jgi:hypothetical protein